MRSVAIADCRLATVGGLDSADCRPAIRQCSVRFDGGNLVGHGCWGDAKGCGEGRARDWQFGGWNEYCTVCIYGVEHIIFVIVRSEGDASEPVKVAYTYPIVP